VAVKEPQANIPNRTGLPQYRQFLSSTLHISNLITDGVGQPGEIRLRD
jgi:hypothetical protein